MSGFTTVLALIVMGLVVIVLIRGLFNMLKGQDANRSNKLMQLRLLLQAIAIVLIMLTLWLTGGGRWYGETEKDL
ncbi:MAG TPA: twin transmembrane helix small protein, partial [Agrobacterium sp.]|nr:twin transmembrane helix small protein [Agrobacterium sp.]